MNTKAVVQAYFQKLRVGEDWTDEFAEDVVFTSYTSPVKTIKGKSAFIGATRRFYASVKSFEIRGALYDAAQACVTTRYWLDAKDGTAFESDVAELFEVRDHQVVSFAIYFDTAPFPK